MPQIEHFRFSYRLQCPIHSAFFCGMGGRPTNFRSTPFRKMLQAFSNFTTGSEPFRATARPLNRLSYARHTRSYKCRTSVGPCESGVLMSHAASARRSLIPAVKIENPPNSRIRNNPRQAHNKFHRTPQKSAVRLDGLFLISSPPALCRPARNETSSSGVFFRREYTWPSGPPAGMKLGLRLAKELSSCEAKDLRFRLLCVTFKGARAFSCPLEPAISFLPGC